MLFCRDLAAWFGQPFFVDDEGERAIREGGLQMALAILEHTTPGADQERAIMRIRETCLFVCANRRPANMPAKSPPLSQS